MADCYAKLCTGIPNKLRLQSLPLNVPSVLQSNAASTEMLDLLAEKWISFHQPETAFTWPMAGRSAADIHCHTVPLVRKVLRQWSDRTNTYHD